MYECMFTGRRSSTPFAEEHAPPRSFGGGFVSTRSVSTEFNNRCGHSLDLDLERIWFETTTRLAVLMPSGGSKRTMSVRVDGRRYSIERGGALRNRDPVIERHSDGKRIKSVQAPTARMVRQAARADPTLQLGEILAAPPTLKEPRLPMDRVLLTPAAEVGALRHLLVVMDVTEDSRGGSWVRSADCLVARQLVVEMVERLNIHQVGAFEVLRGVDAGLHQALMRLTQSFAKAQGVQLGEFEHVFVAEGNPMTRLINAAWIVFGAEVMKFQLAADYRGKPFLTIAGFDPCSTRRGWFRSVPRCELRWGPRGASSVVVPEALGAPPSVEVRLVALQRAHTAARAHVAATLGAPEREPEFVANYYLFCRQQLERTPATCRALIRERLVPAYQEADVERALAALGAEFDFDFAIPEGPRWRMGEHPPWASHVATAYVAVVRWMRERLIIPSIFDGQVTRTLTTQAVTERDLDPDGGAD